MTPILQKRLPYDPLQVRKLPGIQPLAPEIWLVPDDAFAGQMAERERLLAGARGDVLRLDADAMAAAQELLEMAAEAVDPGSTAEGRVTRADGVEVTLDREDPLGSLGRITQQDFCILQKPEGAAEHVLTGAVLCFPASWTLAEKFMRPLTAIHIPVESYDAGLAARVQRLFDGVQPGRPLWRFNALWYHDPTLHQPRSEHAPRAQPPEGQAQYLRSEKQAIHRLPRTRAVVFSIHTSVVARQDLPAATAG
ncbi:heme-dependent oxidative N-demethylase family protein [Cribrihabitans neustonicus]|uniref:heme-dependent oxidative N-demethylase family protein n=1 Tax=Cribrihabitans neustonicus TaxID=1429085 RepID=UPI003B5BED67